MKTKNIEFELLRNESAKISFFSALVVDGYDPAKKMLSSSLWALPQIGEIEFANSGEEALAKIGCRRYDLIFLDVVMPGLDGFETCGLIREVKGYEITPIIMVSGNTSSDNYFKRATSGCSGYVTKPIQHEPFRKLNLEMLTWLQGYKQA